MFSVLGLDIGGANLKAVHSDGTARLRGFALWKQPDHLPATLVSLVEQMPPFDTAALTMTGELCDCFESQKQGVEFILDVAAQVIPNKKLHVWQTDGRFVDVPTARSTPQKTAAANWLALATYAGRFATAGAALLIDIGSTTSDIIPLIDGKPIPQGRTDTERMAASELVYTGIERTPICALLGSTVAAELFATTLDAYLLLDAVPENEDRPTADGRPAAKSCAHRRLARMIGGDAETCSLNQTMALARQAVSVQQTILQHALRRVVRTLPARPDQVILSGGGEFLARLVLLRERFDEEQLICLSNHLGPMVSSCACAHALAVLAGEQQHE